ncbi:MAG: MATE family efflux transporter, partial [Planctomycetota bacterium]
AYNTSAGCAAAAAVIVGQCLGARDPLRAHAGAWTAVRLAVWLAGAWGLLLFLLPFDAVDLLSPDARTTAHAVDYFSITACSFAFMAVELVLEGAFSGAGDTLPPMLLGLPLTLLRIPAAILLARTAGWGVAGVFWAITWTSVARGLLLALWFARGRWVRGRA